MLQTPAYHARQMSQPSVYQVRFRLPVHHSIISARTDDGGIKSARLYIVSLTSAVPTQPTTNYELGEQLG